MHMVYSTCETLYEVLLQGDGTVQSLPSLVLRQTLVQVPGHTNTLTQQCY